MEQQKKQKSSAYYFGVIGLVVFFGGWELLVHAGVISSAPCVRLPLQFRPLFKVKQHQTGWFDAAGPFSGKYQAFSDRFFFSGSARRRTAGVLMGYYKVMNSFATPLFEIIRRSPSPGFDCILTLGIGFKAKVSSFLFRAFVPCVVNSYLGIS
jgi:NitT/TauT family transport system permease protein